MKKVLLAISILISTAVCGQTAHEQKMVNQADTAFMVKAKTAVYEQAMYFQNSPTNHEKRFAQLVMLTITSNPEWFAPFMYHLQSISGITVEPNSEIATFNNAATYAFPAFAKAWYSIVN